MSTTIKPLDIYIGGTKVFPDVNTGVLEYPIYSDMYEDTQKIALQHNAIYSELDKSTFNMPSALVYPMINDIDSSVWHTNSNPVDNYWNFVDNEYAILSIPFDINQSWLPDAFINTAWSGAFHNLNVTILNFDQNTVYPNTVGYDWNDHDSKIIDFLWCRELFGDCKNLVEIHGLNLGGTREHMHPSSGIYIYSDKTQNGAWYDDRAKTAWDNMFLGCKNLTTLDITWPEPLTGTNNPVLYGDTGGMFHGCHSFSETSIPTFAVRPFNQGELVNIGGMFGSTGPRNGITSLHITEDSWPYIENARAWEGTQVTSIDIPATATNLSYIKDLLGENLYTSTEGDYSNNQYIIRTEKPMTDYLNDTNDEHIKLFNFSNYDNNSDFQSTFGGIYIPDSQVTAWQTAIGTDFGAPNIAQNHVHGLSDL